MSIQNNIFMEIGKTIVFKKDAHIFEQGDINPNIYFVKKGLLKAYYITSEGKEFVKSFLDTGELIGSLRSASKDSPCYFSVVCLEETEVLSVPFNKLIEHSKKNLDTATLLMNNLIELSMKKEKREYEFLCMSAQERYELFLSERPQIIDRVSLNDVAKFLGITAIALSRIRKRINI